MTYQLDAVDAHKKYIPLLMQRSYLFYSFYSVLLWKIFRQSLKAGLNFVHV